MTRGKARQRSLRAWQAGLRQALAVVLLLGLNGCMVGPNFVTPPVPVAPTWIEWRNKALNTHDLLYEDWWCAFRDPTLNRLIEVAYQQNLTLLSAGTRVLQARAALGMAIGELYPQQQQATGSLLNFGISHADPTPVIFHYFWRDTINLQATWELDFWGKFRRGVESADAAYLASIANYDDVLVTLLGDVATTYIGIRALEKQISIARANVIKQREVLKIAQERYEGGTATNLDVFQAQNVLGATEATVPQLTIQLQLGLNALRVLLGIAPEPLGTLLAGSSGKIPAAPARVAVGIPADLLRRRPDIRTAELRAAAQSAQVGVAEAELYPAISIMGSFGGVASNVGGHNLGQVFQPIGRTYVAGPSFQWNILNYGQIRNNVRLQDATLQQYLIDYQNTVLKAQQEVENGIATFLQSRAQANYLRFSAGAARRALQTAIIEYKEGTREFTAVLTAEQNLYQAESDLARATGNVSLGFVSIVRALGGGWQVRDGNFFVDAATADEMRNRTDWGWLIPSPSEPPPPSPGLPGPEDRGRTIRAPDW